MQLYLRCVWTNNITFFGVISILIGAILLLCHGYGIFDAKLSSHGFIWLGLFMEGLTSGSWETYVICKRVLKKLDKHGEGYALRAIESFRSRDIYCCQVGGEIALDLWRSAQKM